MAIKTVHVPLIELKNNQLITSQCSKEDKLSVARLVIVPTNKKKLGNVFTVHADQMGNEHSVSFLP